MSWEASGFVKKIHKNITVTEKFVLLVLADYHRTDERYVAWPSQDTIARDCLMTSRAIRQILVRLESKNFIEKLAGGCGRGNVTSYRIVGLEKEEPQTRNVETGFPVHEKRNVAAKKEERGDVKEEPPCSAIRKEPIEPIREPIQEPSESPSAPESLLLIPPTNGNKSPDVIAGAFKYFCQQSGKTKNYILTDKRRKMAEKRWGEVQKIASLNNPPDRIEIEAKRLLKNAMDGLLESDFMREKGLLAWEQVFRSADDFSKWLDRWENPPEQKGKIS